MHEEEWQDADETTALLEGEQEVEPSRWHVSCLVLIGFAPLASCVLIGESAANVLVAMVAMHWGCMVVLPAMYYSARLHEEVGFGESALAFYSRLVAEQRRELLWKSLRGSVLGVPVFVGVCAGYLAFRCETAKWALCIKSFRHPLEAYGFESHSMPFRTLAAVYFTFWNPVIEEFFWRVFLHRELGAAFGLRPEEEAKIGLADQGEEGPWASLWLAAKGCLPGRAARVRWGVSVMYASYHTWPMKVVFQNLWWAYVVSGFCFLVCLGRFFLVLREHPRFGLPAAYVVHAWVDAGFALLCLFEVHPAELFAVAT